MSNDIVAAFCAHQRVVGRAQRTIDRRAWSLTAWARHLDERGVTLATATIDDLEIFLARWPSPQSRYSICADIHQLYRYARRSRPGLADPTDRLDRIRVPRRAATPIPAADVQRLITAVAEADRLVVMLAAYAGLRTVEIAAADSHDVDLGGRWLTVRGKGGHVDRVPIAAPLAAELARQSRHGRLVSPPTGAAVGARIRRLLRRHGIAGRPHDLRHSFATEAVRATNGNIVAVSRLMRHAEVATTMRYVRPDFDLHAVVDRLYAA
jgi:integrase